MTETAPYLSIADGIRRRIASGELAPGDRVPSTRAIVRDTGVAMATATKALAVLAREGLVRAVPGVGTVVAETAPARGRAQETPLSRDVVVAAAVRIADTEGLAGLSMRRVAADLGTSTMALYRHVPSKGELVRLMTDVGFAEADPGHPAGDWRAQLTYVTRRLWDAYRAHPWMARAMASFNRPEPMPEAMTYTESVLRALRGTSLTAHQIMLAHLTLIAFVQGLGLAMELEGHAVQDTGVSNDAWMERHGGRFAAIVSRGHYPVLTTLFEHEPFAMDLDSLFGFGLDRLLDGIAVSIRETSA
ncbi:TetR/AcrR family transcriptional regulator C-terminal domain-containing protein [Streptomyces sp. NBC_00083]|uniref:TetR/AcrR family transcriptional regulator C-terminal domain-containing protein n=1 Tax=Streptomyces sp. NBC_00083 TaxID=2975647 RepID=UPI00225AF24F|nr:TetR/AcrR family transcriptional regulator C-terminal domain-containing protein [Streptomyces sp. NBC_00083]MCX5385785.1 TetR/AcrR family transcriptional regulator C-terminal domain-containing protein [Streptomyces sp. NBC_00083]